MIIYKEHESAPPLTDKQRQNMARYIRSYARCGGTPEILKGIADRIWPDPRIWPDSECQSAPSAVPDGSPNPHPTEGPTT